MADAATITLPYMKLKKWMLENGCEQVEVSNCMDKPTLLLLLEKKGMMPAEGAAAPAPAPAPAAAPAASGDGDSLEPCDKAESCRLSRGIYWLLQGQEGFESGIDADFVGKHYGDEAPTVLGLLGGEDVVEEEDFVFYIDYLQQQDQFLLDQNLRAVAELEGTRQLLQICGFEGDMRQVLCILGGAMMAFCTLGGDEGPIEGVGAALGGSQGAELLKEKLSARMEAQAWRNWWVEALATEGLAAQDMLTSLEAYVDGRASRMRMQVTAEIEEGAARLVTSLLERGIKLVAIDCDLTLIDCHTGGCWEGSAEDLSQKVRPELTAFIPKAVQAGLRCGIATHSPQAQLIHAMLEIVFPDIAKDLPVRGDSLSSASTVTCEDGSEAAVITEGTRSKVATKEGSQLVRKQLHIASLMDRLLEQGMDLAANQTCLIDDDDNNVAMAEACGVIGLWLDPNQPRIIFSI